MQPHDIQVGATRDFTIDGQTYPVSGLTPYMLGQLEAHLKDAFPSPLAEHAKLMRACGDGFTPEERKELFDAARATMSQAFDADGVQTAGWPVTFNSQRAQLHFFGGQGIGVFLRVVLAKHTPEITATGAERLGVLCGADDLRRLTELLQVRGPDDEDDETPAAPVDPLCELPAGCYDPKA